MNFQELVLQGNHVHYRTMASTAMPRALEMRKDGVREAFLDFKNIEHRIEHVRDIENIRYINDSKATNVNAAWYALEDCGEYRPVVWIAGGYSPKGKWIELEDVVFKNVRAIVCIGRQALNVKKAFNSLVNNIAMAKNMRQAVYQARTFANKGDTILLSPACSAFDMYQDYESRGNHYKRIVKSI